MSIDLDALRNRLNNLKNAARGLEQVKIVTITPDLAAMILELNTHNRKSSEGNLKTLAKDMNAGRFILSNDAIVLSESWVLLNGAHRLKECVDTDTPIRAILFTGAVDSSQAIMDQGKTRGLIGALQIEGIPESKTLGSLIRGTFVIASGDRFERVPALVALEFANLFSSELMATAKIVETGRPVQVRKQWIGAAHFIVSTFLGQRAAADEFVRQVYTGVNVPEGSAAATFIKYCYRNHPLHDADAVTNTVHTFLKFLDGETIKALRPPKTFQMLPFNTVALQREIDRRRGVGTSMGDIKEA